MKSLQLTYPFFQTLLENVTYLQIGIQRPYNIPVTEILEEESFQIPIRINGQNFTIVDMDVLEFSDIHFRNLNIQIDRNDKRLKYIIVDLAYETAG